jgi:DAK2 domain fusion protein YloV
MPRLFPHFNRQKTRRVAVFDGQDYRKAMLSAAAWLEQHREAINKLNVFPVPDGDTGNNMAATMRAALKEIADSAETNVSVIANRLSEGAIRGARGNSGVILSQILRGIARSLQNNATFTAEEFAAALEYASQMAYRAVIKPVEGTILTVIRESAEAARQIAARGCDVATLMQEVVSRARQAVAHTPDLLPLLKQAGVVDAGGQGLATIFEGFLRYAQGEAVPDRPQSSLPDLNLDEIHRGAVSVDEEFGYEVVFLLRGQGLDLNAIRDTIVQMGGVSTVVAGDETIVKVHTHTPSPGKILDYGVSLGSLEDINIENLQAQSLRYAEASAQERGVANTSTATAGAIPQERPPSATVNAAPLVGDIGTIAVATGEGFRHVFEGLRVSAVVSGGQTMNPSTEELLTAVNSVPASRIIILPNNSNIIMSARQVQELTSKSIRVVPTRSMPQGVAALTVLNEDLSFEDNAAAMERAANEINTGEITRAVRDAQVDGLIVHQGDVIALVNDVLVAAGTDEIAVLRRALEKMDAASRDLVTLYFGQDISQQTAAATAQLITEWFPNADIEVVDGGQPYYTYVLSAE